MLKVVLVRRMMRITISWIETGMSVLNPWHHSTWLAPGCCLRRPPLWSLKSANFSFSYLFSFLFSFLSAPGCACRLLRSSVCWGIRDRAPVRHSTGCDSHQQDCRDAAEPVLGAGHNGWSQARGASPELHPGTWRPEEHQACSCMTAVTAVKKVIALVHFCDDIVQLGSSVQLLNMAQFVNWS